jgi:hypothetical protein
MIQAGATRAPVQLCTREMGPLGGGSLDGQLTHSPA